MTRLQTEWRIPQCEFYGLAIGLVVGGLMLGGLTVPGAAFAQGSKSKKSGSDTEKILGTVSSVEKKGKTAKLTVTKKDGGDDIEINILPKTAFAVVASGDVTFLRPQNMVSAEALVSNDKLFAGTFTVYVGIKPEPKMQQDPMNESCYRICGLITAADKDGLVVDLPGGPQQVLFEQAGNVKVTVNSGDAALAAEGAPVELEGATKVGKFLPSKITVTLAEPFKAEDVFANDKSSAASKAKAAAAAKTAASKTSKTTKTTKTKEDAAAPGDPAASVQAADPFGVIKKKDTKKDSKTKAADEMDADKADKKGDKKAAPKKKPSDAAEKDKMDNK